MKSTRFTERLNFEKELKSTVWGREFRQFIIRSRKKLAHAVCGLALEELEFMPTSVLAGATNKQIIKIDIYQTKINCTTLKQIIRPE